MTLKITDKSIDLSNLNFRDYSEEETRGFRRVRSEYSRLFQPVLQALADDPSILPSVEIPYDELLKTIDNILELEEAEAWLATKLEHISETRRAQNSDIKPHLDQIITLARATKKLNPKVAGLFAQLIDFLAEPSKKGAATTRSKKKSSSSKKEE
jgi:hypothetical protein